MMGLWHHCVATCANGGPVDLKSHAFGGFGMKGQLKEPFDVALG